MDYRVKTTFSAYLLMLNCAHAAPPLPSDLIAKIKRNEHGQLIAVPVGDLPSPENKLLFYSPPTNNNNKLAITTKSSNNEKLTTFDNIRNIIGSDNSQPICEKNSITCIEVISTANITQASVPFTFGQPFRIGDITKYDVLKARDSNGTIHVQMDEETTHPDDSLSFAVLTTNIVNLKAGERRVINLYRERATSNNSTNHPSSHVSLDIKLHLTVFSPQITRVTFGDRNGTTPGHPFLTGEQITLHLGDRINERFTLAISQEMSGGDFTTLTKIAAAFNDLINSKSRNFRAFRIGEGDGFENLWITPRSLDYPSFSVKSAYGGSGYIKINNIKNFSPPKRLYADANKALESTLRTETKKRLNGSIAKEFNLVLPLIDANTGIPHSQLTARLDARFFENDKRIRADLIIENNWAYNPDPGNIIYKLSVTQGNNEIINVEPFTHHHHARWHTVFWINDEPKIHLRYNMPYFLISGATWNYDLGLKIPDSVLAEEATRLQGLEKTPMSPAFINPYFPTTGGRQEIGPLPRWTALYLITQDHRALTSMLTNANAAATIPIHYRDAKTDLPVSLESHPGIALLDGRSDQRDIPPAMSFSDTPWFPDRAHQGSFAYIPYLVTGDRFYQEETLFWATWNMGSYNPSYREGSKGLIHSDQVRGQAWALRSIYEATRVLPEKHPMASYFKRRLNDNLKWYVNNYPRNTKNNENISPLGAIEKPDDTKITAPWQNDFMSLVVGQIAESGNSIANEYFQWLNNFTVGRFLHENDGYCRANAPAYYIKIKQDDGKMINNWNTLAKVNSFQTPSCSPNITEGYPDSPSGYVAYSRAMLANSSNLNYPKAKEAYNWLTKATPKIDEKMHFDPTWAIVPR